MITNNFITPDEVMYIMRLLVSVNCIGSEADFIISILENSQNKEV